MTKQKAIRELELIKGRIEWEYPIGGQIALDVAIEALKEKHPCGLCKYYDGDDWGICQYCPAEPKGSDTE